jgi:hypothetical protein
MSGSVIQTEEVDDLVEEVETEELETEQPQQQSVDWESRFKGLQGGYQQAVERAARAEQQAFAMSAQQFAQSLQDLEPEEAQARYQNWVREQQLTRAQQQMAQQLTQADQAMKMVAVMTLSQKYGVPKEDLMGFDDPVSMENAAKLAAKNRRSGKKQADKEPRKRDDFGSTGAQTVAAPKEKAKNLRDARNKFRESARQKFGSN